MLRASNVLNSLANGKRLYPTSNMFSANNYDRLAGGTSYSSIYNIAKEGFAPGSTALNSFLSASASIIVVPFYTTIASLIAVCPEVQGFFFKFIWYS